MYIVVYVDICSQCFPCSFDVSCCIAARVAECYRTKAAKKQATEYAADKAAEKDTSQFQHSKIITNQVTLETGRVKGSCQAQDSALKAAKAKASPCPPESSPQMLPGPTGPQHRQAAERASEKASPQTEQRHRKAHWPVLQAKAEAKLKVARKVAQEAAQEAERFTMNVAGPSMLQILTAVVWE